MIRSVLTLGTLLCSLAAVPLSHASENEDDARRLANLEQRIRANQHELDSLDAQLASPGRQDVDAARTEEMRTQIRALLSEQEFREQLAAPTALAGYDNGFYIKSADELFKLSIGGNMQFRWTHYGVGHRNRYLAPRLERDDRTGFDAQRLRLILKGHLHSKDLTYYMQIASDASNGYDTIVRDFYVNYRFADEFQFQAGIFKIAATQSELMSDSAVSFVDRPMVNDVFTFARGLGIRFWGQAADKRIEYFVDVVNSFNSYNNRTITTDPAELDGNPAIAARLVWHALGDKPGKDLAVEPDVEFHESPALDLAFHYGFNEDDGDRRTTRIPFPAATNFWNSRGGFGLTRTTGLQINQFGLASAFKWQGFSARGEYMVRVVDVRNTDKRPLTPWYLLSGDASTVAQHGAYVQVGYVLPIPGLEKKLEAVARVGGISALADDQEGAWEYTGGLNYYLHGNSVKLQTDVTKITEVPISSSTMANVNDSPLIWRVQLQVAF